MRLPYNEATPAEKMSFSIPGNWMFRFDRKLAPFNMSNIENT